MRNCLLKICETNTISKNGTDIEMLTKESQSIVENLKETARLVLFVSTNLQTSLTKANTYIASLKI